MVQVSMYHLNVKQRELKKRLAEYGWYFLKQGGRHEKWTNGEIYQAIPRHNKINDKLAKAILKKAQDNPSKEV